MAGLTALGARFRRWRREAVGTVGRGDLFLVTEVTEGRREREPLHGRAHVGHVGPLSDAALVVAFDGIRRGRTALLAEMDRGVASAETSLRLSCECAAGTGLNATRTSQLFNILKTAREKRQARWFRLR